MCVNCYCWVGTSLYLSTDKFFRHRHLLNDLVAMLPHGRKDAKLDTKSKLYHLNEIADLYNCNNVLFFEARKRQDLYMWMSKAPNGPCIKLHVQNCISSYRADFPKFFTESHSAYNGRASFHRKRPKGFSAYPQL